MKGGRPERSAAKPRDPSSIFPILASEEIGVSAMEFAGAAAFRWYAGSVCPTLSPDMLAFKLHKGKHPNTRRGSFWIPIVDWRTARTHVRNWAKTLAPVHYLTLISIPKNHPVYVGVDWSVRIALPRRAALRPAARHRADPAGGFETPELQTLRWPDPGWPNLFHLRPKRNRFGPGHLPGNGSGSRLARALHKMDQKHSPADPRQYPRKTTQKS